MLQQMEESARTPLQRRFFYLIPGHGGGQLSHPVPPLFLQINKDIESWQSNKLFLYVPNDAPLSPFCLFPLMYLGIAEFL